MFYRAIILMFFVLASYSYHIAGADFTYEYLGNYRYKLSFTMFRDCSLDGSGLPVAGFDEQIYFFVFTNDTKELYRMVMAPKPRTITLLYPEAADKCLVDPTAVCIEVGTYEAVVTLPPRPKGYTIIWQRCCRNMGITNLYRPDEQGATFLVTIPGSDAYPENSSPVFKNLPPLFLCVNKMFLFDHSAMDPDGDSLVYQIGLPLDSKNFQSIGPDKSMPVADPNFPAGPPPYNPVAYQQGYSYLKPFGANNGSIFEIDKNSGFLKIFPPQLGIYAVAIDVYEYRNGKLLGRTRREIQFYVENCLPPGPPLNITHYFPPNLTVKNDTIILMANEEGCYTAEITANPFPQGNIKVTPYATYLGLPNLNITISGQDTVKVQTCWTPTCDYVEQVIPFIIRAYDDGTCYYYTQVFDTIYINIKPPDTTKPTVELVPINFNIGDSVWFGDTVCMQFEARADDNLTLEHEFKNVGSGAEAPTINYIIQTDTLIKGTICWVANCEAILDPALFIVTASKSNICGPPLSSKDSVYLYVKLPYNPKPQQTVVVDTNTIIGISNGFPVVYVEDSVCYFFEVRDSSPASKLEFQVEIQDINNNPYSGNNIPSIQILQNYGDTLIKGRACWKVDCEYLNDTINFIFKTLDYNECVLQYVIINKEPLVVESPPTDPIFLFWNAVNLPVVNDTIILNVKLNSCVELTLIDTLNNGNLTIWGEGPLFDGIPPDGYIPSGTGTGIFTTNFCFTPTCGIIDSVYPVQIIGKSDIYCRTPEFDTTKFFIRVIQPENNPPTLSRDIPSPSPVTVAEKLCYNLILEDPDDYILYEIGDLGEVFSENFGYGSNAVITKIDTLAPNKIRFTICIEPNCYVNEENLFLKFCVEDTSTCDTTYKVCDELVLQVSDCGLIMPNVFTPNGDGINDIFEPRSMEGIRDYELYIFNRWGKQLSYTKNEGWNPPASIPEGVYFYKIIFYFYEGNGPEWKREQVGSFTLIR